MKPISLCQQCLKHEIISWLAEKSLKPKTANGIYSQLQKIKEKSGECIVCKSKHISTTCFNNILKLLEREKAASPIRSEFISMFGLVA
jgi:hypothetical protein